ncbi:hypothetical protein ACGF13_06690 [Kitasatospora sp. NPDC048286]|uniref:hypothetical protein n=1 Tax=Kitasatospora sp. NPDC048286 TaxID=3364047 RepID=UPI003721E167
MARLLATGVAPRGPVATTEPTRVNGHPAPILRIDGEFDPVVAMRLDEGRTTGIHSARNAEKPTHMDRETPVTLSPVTL